MLTGLDLELLGEDGMVMFLIWFRQCLDQLWNVVRNTVYGVLIIVRGLIMSLVIVDICKCYGCFGLLVKYYLYSVLSKGY
jgi:hypothetical protein